MAVKAKKAVPRKAERDLESLKKEIQKSMKVEKLPLNIERQIEEMHTQGMTREEIRAKLFAEAFKKESLRKQVKKRAEAKPAPEPVEKAEKRREVKEETAKEEQEVVLFDKLLADKKKIYEKKVKQIRKHQGLRQAVKAQKVLTAEYEKVSLAARELEREVAEGTITEKQAETKMRNIEKQSAFSTLRGKCFIATAAYGTPMAEEINALRGFRDKVLLTNRIGIFLTDSYYRLSPPIAEAISRHDSLRAITRALLKPLVILFKKFE